MHLDPWLDAGGHGEGAMLSSGSGRQSWGGGDAAGGSGGLKDDLKNPNVPMVELPIGATWEEGPSEGTGTPSAWEMRCRWEGSGPERRKLRMEPNLLEFWHVVRPLG